MIEYPTILPSSRAPRQSCIAFEKLDGSNIRVKYTQKKGFSLFGSRTQLIDQTHPHLGAICGIFFKDFEAPLTEIIEKNWPDEREVIVFGEFFGDKSFAGWHDLADTTKRFVLFDIMVGHKNRKFILPQEFIKLCQGKVAIPRVVYEGNLNDQFIQSVREGDYGVEEGVVCKGKQRSGAARGGVWMAKIKTEKYLDALFNKFGQDGVAKYGE